MAKTFATILTIFALSMPFKPAAGTESVVGYYPSWVHSEFAPGDLEFERLTHVIHAFAWPTADGDLDYPADFIDSELTDNAHQHGVFVMLALGGWGQSAGFSPMVADSSARKNFAATLLSFCLQHDYDGIDIDWEFPENFQDRQNLTLLVKDIRDEFSKPMRPQPLFISMAVSTGNWVGQWFDYAELQKQVDWFGCMTYDFHGPWTDHSGHNSPLYASGGDRCGSVDSGIRYLTQTRGLPVDKVLLGVPFYARGFNSSGLYQPSSGDGGEFSYADVVHLLNAGWTRRWDDVAKVPWLVNGDNTKLISYDDALSVRYKAEYAIEKNLKGLMIWALGQDFIDGKQPLLKAVSDPVLHPTRVGQRKEKTPSTFSLTGFPNPFNDSAVISFQLAEEQAVVLELFDVHGRLAAHVLAGVQPAGKNHVRLSGHNLPSGLYLCRLETASRIEMKKMMLIH